MERRNSAYVSPHYPVPLGCWYRGERGESRTPYRFLVDSGVPSLTSASLLLTELHRPDQIFGPRFEEDTVRRHDLTCESEFGDFCRGHETGCIGQERECHVILFSIVVSRFRRTGRAQCRSLGRFAAGNAERAGVTQWNVAEQRCLPVPTCSRVNLEGRESRFYLESDIPLVRGRN